MPQVSHHRPRGTCASRGDTESEALLSFHDNGYSSGELWQTTVDHIHIGGGALGIRNVEIDDKPASLGESGLNTGGKGDTVFCRSSQWLVSCNSARPGYFVFSDPSTSAPARNWLGWVHGYE